MLAIPGPGPCARSSYSSSKVFVSSALFSLLRWSPDFWEVVTGEGDRGRICGLDNRRRAPEPCTQQILQDLLAHRAFPCAIQGHCPKDASCSHLGFQGAAHNPRLPQIRGWIRMSPAGKENVFLRVPIWWVIPSNAFSHTFSMKAGASPERCWSAPCSPPSHPFQNSPALPEPPVSDPNTALPVPYTFISVSLHLY